MATNRLRCSLAKRMGDDRAPDARLEKTYDPTGSTTNMQLLKDAKHEVHAIG